MTIKLSNKQIWKSKTHPHEDFKIYHIIIQEWDNHPSESIYCWERVNSEAFDKFIMNRKGITLDEYKNKGMNTYPYAWAGECGTGVLRSKIKKYDMYVEGE